MKRITLYYTLGIILTASFFILILSAKHCDECFSSNAMALKFFAVGLVFAGGSLYFKSKFLETEKIIFDIESEPVLHTDEAADEVPFTGEGIIENGEEQLLESPYAKKPCVYYHSITEKYIKRGKHSYWEVIANTADYVSFYLKDSKGKLKIDLANMDEDFSEYDLPLPESSPDPENSEIDCEAVFRRNEYAGDKPGLLGLLSSNTLRRTEYILAPNTRVFVFGAVKKIDNTLVLRESERYPLIISRKNRNEYINDFYRGVNLVYFAPILLSVGYTVSLFSMNYLFKWSFAVFWLLFFIGNGLIFGSFLFSLYNRIVTLKQRALNAESNIDVELVRRAQLIPRLAEVVKGYAADEREVQKIVAESRSEKNFSKELVEKSTAVMPALVAVIENYPNLKAAQNFQALMGTLVDTENRISHSREFYNLNTRKYNSLIAKFPYLMVSLPLEMKEMEYLTIAHSEKNASQVFI